MCETSFASSGPYWHAYTNGKETPLIFLTMEDFVFTMNAIALTVAVTRIQIIAFEIMGNHLHFVISASKDDALIFWKELRRRLARHYPAFKDMPIGLKQLETLSALRNNIVYVNRNGYVADSAYTPFSYPWGTGRYYFLDQPEGVPLSTILYDNRRNMFRTRTPDIPLQWKAKNGYVLPSEFCAVRFGMALFRDGSMPNIRG